MADPKKTTQLDPATQVNDDDILAIVQGVDSKQATFQMVRDPLLKKSENLGDLDDAETARTNLGLGTAATADDSDFATAAQGATADAAAQLNEANTWSAAQRGAYVALVTASNLLPINLALSNNFSHTMSEDTTLQAPTNAVAGQSGVIEITQDNDTAKTLAFNAFWKTAGGLAMTISTTLSSKNVIAYVVDSTGTFATCSLSAAVA
jgi:hypothetical protein